MGSEGPARVAASAAAGLLLMARMLCGAVPAQAAGESSEAANAPQLDKTSAPADAPSASPDTVRVKIGAPLDGTRWPIEWQPLYGPKPQRPLDDVLSFSDGKMTSERLTADGFGPSRVTVRDGEGGVVAWESEQLSQDAGIVLWDGEVRDGVLQGTLSKQPLEGEAQDYVFLSRPTAQDRPPQSASSHDRETAKPTDAPADVAVPSSETPAALERAAASDAVERTAPSAGFSSSEIPTTKPEPQRKGW